MVNPRIEAEHKGLDNPDHPSTVDLIRAGLDGTGFEIVAILDSSGDWDPNRIFVAPSDATGRKTVSDVETLNTVMEKVATSMPHISDPARDLKGGNMKVGMVSVKEEDGSLSEIRFYPNANYAREISWELRKLQIEGTVSKNPLNHIVDGEITRAELTVMNNLKPGQNIRNSVYRRDLAFSSF